MRITLSQLASLAHDAYRDTADEDKFYFGRGSCQGFVQPNKAAGCVIVAFRGTDAIEDWGTNLDVGTATAPGIGLVYEGFHESLSDGLNSIEDAWTAAGLAPWHIPLRSRGLPVVCTGHSLGGSLATLMAGRLRRRAVAAVTFGAPKLMSAWEDAYPAVPIWNVVHGYDLVPRLPRVAFKHAGMQVYWGAGPTLRWFWRPVVGGIKDHKISRYEEYIAANPRYDQVLSCVDGDFTLGEANG